MVVYTVLFNGDPDSDYFETGHGPRVDGVFKSMDAVKKCINKMEGGQEGETKLRYGTWYMDVLEAETYYEKDAEDIDDDDDNEDEIVGVYVVQRWRVRTGPRP